MNGNPQERYLSPLTAPRPQLPPSLIPEAALSRQAESWSANRSVDPQMTSSASYGAPAPGGFQLPPRHQSGQQAYRPDSVLGAPPASSAPALPPNLASYGRQEQRGGSYGTDGAAYYPSQQAMLPPLPLNAPPLSSNAQHSVTQQPYYPSHSQQLSYANYPSSSNLNHPTPPVPPQINHPPPAQYPNYAYSDVPPPPLPPSPYPQQPARHLLQPSSSYQSSQSSYLPALASLSLAPSPIIQLNSSLQGRGPPPMVAQDYRSSPQLERPLLDHSRHTSTIGQSQLYTSTSEAPPQKLAASYPDIKVLGTMREVALAGDMDVKVAWSKQVLKFIERHQANAGESSRISDPTLVRFVDEALQWVLASADSPSPVSLALYLRGDLSSSGSFPSYRAKDARLAFRDFEASSNLGYIKALFRVGKAYEDAKDTKRAVDIYQKGAERLECGCLYRLGIANLMGNQLGLEAPNLNLALHYLTLASESADMDNPQPGYVLGLILAGEFESVTLPRSHLDLDLAKIKIERAAFLQFGPAQFKLGQCYELAALGCPFDPLISVQYYALASQNGEAEASLALSKWYLAGSDDGSIEKDEVLAVTFAEKAARKGLVSAEFALGYYQEVGVGNGRRDLVEAKRWYERAAGKGNQEAAERLQALNMSEQNALTTEQHRSHVDTRLVRKRTQAANDSKARQGRQQPAMPVTQASEGLRRRDTAKLVQRAAGFPSSPSIGGSLAQNGAGARTSVGDSPRRAAPPRTSSAQQYALQQMAPSTPPRNPNFSSAHQGSRDDSPNRLAQSLSHSSPSQPAPSAAQQYRHTVQSSSQPALPQQSSYQLTDDARPAPQAQTSIPTAIEQPDTRKAFSTFAEMGVATQKAKKDDCVVM